MDHIGKDLAKMKERFAVEDFSKNVSDHVDRGNKPNIEVTSKAHITHAKRTPI